MRKLLLIGVLLLVSNPLVAQEKKEKAASNPPIYIAFLWHMHQPLYWPGETILETEANNYYPYSVFDIHNSRTGPYTNWPKIAIQKGIDASLPHAGASVSFSGTLVENLNHLEDNGNGNFQNWTSHWNSVINQTTSQGNPRMDMIGFGYYHPLMGLIEYDDIRAQIQKHKTIMDATFDGSYSKGIFPPENAFSLDMIPALADEGIEWALVDNIHFDRAAEGYPFNTSGNLYEPNRADIQNPDPDDWVQLNNLWAPTQVSAQWGHQPHFVEYTDPNTGRTSRIIAVPTSRYLGNEDGRGGFGALQYESVMSQLEPFNKDPDHPILIVLHHDGDNFGGGSEGYYNGNFHAFVDWAVAQPNRFVPTTVQDYLDMFPPDENDVIHIEPGSWAGADNGDPEFKKWLGDPGADGYSPDRNSWGVVTAAKNYVEHAKAVSPGSFDTKDAETFLLNAQGSDYWYWDNSIDGVWDTHPTTASNLAIQKAQNAIAGNDGDTTPPSIFKPQREPYNPGGKEWTIPQDNNFEVWTYAFDVNGLQSVELKYRAFPEADFTSRTKTFSDISPTDTSWKSIEMSGAVIESRTNSEPMFKADEFTANITEYNDTYIEYYVEATDVNGNSSRSLIQYVWVGANSGTGGGGGGGTPINTRVEISPENPTQSDTITVVVSDATQNAVLHWGVNNLGSNWTTPNEVYRPEGSVQFNGTGPAVESPFDFNPDSSTLTIKIGPFNNEAQTVDRVNFVIHYSDDTWDNNSGNDYLVDFGTDTSGGGGGDSHSFSMDGNLDGNATPILSDGGLTLYADWDSPFLYLATESATGGAEDKFIFVADEAGSMVNSPWGKSGQVAAWGAFLANEQSNNYQSWFDHVDGAESKAGSYLEGVINIETEFGEIPSSLFLALGTFGTDDGANLVGQLPAGNGDGNIDANELFEFQYVLTSNEDEEFIPDNFRLLQNYPNPFNPSTEIVYELSEASNIRLTVFDVLGREIAVLVKERQQAGFHGVRFDANGLSSGIYFYRLESTGSVIATKKMMLLK